MILELFSIIFISLNIHAAPQQLQPHPLDPLSSSEILLSSQTINIARPGVSWMYISITLHEPEKSILLPYFLSNTEPVPGIIPRKSLSVLADPRTGRSYEAIVLIRGQFVAELESWTELPLGVDTSFASDEMNLISELALDDPLVIQRLGVYGEFYTNKSHVISDVWKYGYTGDKPEYQGRRLAQVFFYGKLFENDNFYAHPMGFLAIVDSLRKEVVEIEELPIQSDFSTDDRAGDEVPETEGNYDPEISGRWYRDDISPITIQQEDGPSFKILDNVLHWQKFKMRVGRNGREGLVLHTVSYNDSNLIRPLIYRASLSELFVPYADPRPPFHRKMALDVGEYGLGYSASELRSPDGCRGSVFFYDSINNDMSGEPLIGKNTICIYEEDAGILWRKMDPETGRVVTARSQRLVLTFIATVSNYDYQFKWIFYQDASIKVEVVLTGIVSQNLIGSNGSPNGHGTVVKDHVNAQFHQHFFAVRLDVEFDGNNNTVKVVDVVRDVADPGSPLNPYGNGFTIQETVLKTTSIARTKTFQNTARTWKITGDPENLNPITGTPKAWKLIPENGPSLLIHPSSVLHPKASFVDYDVWVTPYKDWQLFAAGSYLNNSGLPEWVAEDPEANIENTDIVLWHVFGISHVTRIEDLPVMPTETIGFWLKPANFFLENPGTDVKPIVFDSVNSRNARRKKNEI